MEDIPAAVVYVGTGLAALFLCVILHLSIRVWQTRVGKGGSAGRKGGQPLAGEVDRLIEELTLLAASPGRMASDPEADAVLTRILEFSLQQMEASGPLAHLVTKLRRARSSEESALGFRELLGWMKANRTALIGSPRDG